MDYAAIRALIAADLSATDQLVRTNLHSDVALINDISSYIIDAGGKRIRPVLAILTARALGYDQDKHTLLAAIIELIHTATLLHDDVVDNSALRRGKATANSMWDNTASVLCGDFLYSRAFQLMVKLDQRAILQILADASNRIAEGEVLQLQNCHKPEITVDSYMQTIRGKTATLFAASMEIAGIIADKPELQKALNKAGTCIGVAFQIIDDVMDYTSDSNDMGKKVGDDLAEGKATLPLIYAMQTSNSQDSQIIADAIIKGDSSQISKIQTILNQCGALEQAKQTAVEQVQIAKDLLSKHLPANDYSQALLSLCDLAVQRTN